MILIVTDSGGASSSVRRSKQRRRVIKMAAYLGVSEYLFFSACLFLARVQPGAEAERDGKQEGPRRRGEIRNRHAGKKNPKAFGLTLLLRNKSSSSDTSAIQRLRNTNGGERLAPRLRVLQRRCLSLGLSQY